MVHIAAYNQLKGLTLQAWTAKTVFYCLLTPALRVAPVVPPPPNTHQVPADPADFSTSFEAAAAESSTAMVTVVQEVLAKTGMVCCREGLVKSAKGPNSGLPPVRSYGKPR